MTDIEDAYLVLSQATTSLADGWEAIDTEDGLVLVAPWADGSVRDMFLVRIHRAKAVVNG